MAINSFPSQAGGGQANLNYIGSVHMSTFNRSWTQGGSAGFYALYSTNQENGYAYFVGSGTSTGAALNKLTYISHSFTRIDIIAPTNDMVSLYKAQVKSTNVYNNPFDADPSINKLAISSFPSVISSSGNFVLPNNALPLINVLLVGGGGGGAHYGGGGGGGNVVKLTAYQAVGTTSVTVGYGGSSSGTGQVGGSTYFGNVYALGGGGGRCNNENGIAGGNGGGAGAHSNGSLFTGGAGISQNASTGLGTSGSPTHHGGFAGGNVQHNNGDHYGVGGAGAAGSPSAFTRNSFNSDWPGGPGHASDIEGTTRYYGSGGGGAQHSPGRGGVYSTERYYGAGGRGTGGSGTENAVSGAVVVRYYIV